MNNLKHINDFFKLYENNNSVKLFKDEEKIKYLLLQNEDFAKGEVHQAIMNIIHDNWSNNKGYSEIVEWTENNLGLLPTFALMLGKYNYQVGNGGHLQYFDNGYASSTSLGFGHDYKDIDLHEDFVHLFKELDIINKLKSGQKAYNVISKFELDLYDESDDCDYCNGSGREDCFSCNGNGKIDCEECGGSGENDEGETCTNCNGDGEVDCEECEGDGSMTCSNCDGDGYIESDRQIPETSEWDNLDTKWYQINDDFMQEFENYLHTLTLDGEPIEDLIKLASHQKYNL